MRCPSRSSTINFHPLEHLHPVKFQRPAETVLYTAGSTIDLRSCSTSLEVADVCVMRYIYLIICFFFPVGFCFLKYH